MRNILFELYYGNIRSDDGMLLKDEAYQQAASQARIVESAFLATLDDSSLKLYYQLEIANSKQDSIESAYIYANGFRTGVNLLLACIYQKDI